MNKKSIIILVVCLIVSVLSVSLAFFSGRIIGDGKNVSVNAKELTINFDNNNEIASGIIEPGWSSANTFSVTNKSKTKFTYDIVLKNYKNTTKTNGYLVYKITSTNGYNMTEYKDMPKDGENTYDLVIARGITIEPGSSNKQSYTLEIKYLDSTEDQSIDMGSTVTGNIYIVESTTNENNQYTKGTLGYQIMEDNSNIKVRTDFSKTYTDVNIGTMYKAKEDNTDVYYFAGDARNNWVKFGGYYWRIIRTNSDGSIRLLYHGTSPETQNSYIGDSEIAFNENYNDSMYVGYKYGTSGSLENNRLNTNDSTIKKTIDTWYKNNLVNYTKYLSTKAVYCNDRELGSGTYSANGNQFYYVGYTRLVANKNPSYNCTNEYDAFSVNNTKAQLTYPIALMTADEISYAGGVLGKNAATWYYLNSKGNASIKNGQNEWWLLSAAVWDTDKSSAVFKVSSFQDRKAILSAQSVQYKLHVRPVISLKKELLYKSGDGSASKPYEVQDLPETIYERLLIDNPTIKTRTDFSTVFTEANTGTLYKSTESISGGESTNVYYFAGDVKNNWVKFGEWQEDIYLFKTTRTTSNGYIEGVYTQTLEECNNLNLGSCNKIVIASKGDPIYWRIIRTNKDESIRLLYSGAKPDTEVGFIDNTCWYKNSKGECLTNSENYLYYTFDDSESEIKKSVEKWYSKNLINYDNYISKNAIYCDDKDYKIFEISVVKEFNSLIRVSGLSGQNPTTWEAFYNGKILPSFSCSSTESQYTSKLSNFGNKQLNYPIGLITADEISFIGGRFGENNTSSWFYKNSVNGPIIKDNPWWTMSSSGWNSTTSYSMALYLNGLLYGPNVQEKKGIRPVISIKGDNIWKSGDGSATKPYEIVTD